MSESASRSDCCPGCGSGPFYLNGDAGQHWCENCEREFWQEASGWYSCGFDGEPQTVDTERVQ